MTATLTYETAEDWFDAIAKGESADISPLPLAAEALGESQDALRKKLKKGTIPQIVIGDTIHLPVSYVTEELRRHRRALETLKVALEKVARDQKTIFYGELMEMIGMSWQSPPDRSRIGVLLGEILDWSYDTHGIFLTSIVHRKSAAPTHPGPGYFPLVAAWKEEDDDVDYDPDADEHEMLNRHMKAVWDHYRKS